MTTDDFEIGETVIVHKPAQDEPPGWPPPMNYLDGAKVVIAQKGMTWLGIIGWTLNPNWCEKLPTAPVAPQSQIEEYNESIAAANKRRDENLRSMFN